MPRPWVALTTARRRDRWPIGYESPLPPPPPPPSPLPPRLKSPSSLLSVMSNPDTVWKVGTHAKCGHAGSLAPESAVTMTLADVPSVVGNLEMRFFHCHAARMPVFFIAGSGRWCNSAILPVNSR